MNGSAIEEEAVDASVVRHVLAGRGWRRLTNFDNHVVELWGDDRGRTLSIPYFTQRDESQFFLQAASDALDSITP